MKVEEKRNDIALREAIDRAVERSTAEVFVFYKFTPFERTKIGV